MSTEQEELKAIPQPKENLFLGNLLEIDPAQSIQSLRRLAHLYGPIYQLRIKNLSVFVSSQKIVHYICDQDKFEKVISGPLVQVRNFAGSGLFTAFSGEHEWTLAHRILVPAFGPLAIKKMQGMMMDIITQMLMSWEHHAGQPFEVAPQYTRLTFDTIGFIAFKTRFNSFHTERLHPFIDIMVKLLVESGNRSKRPALVQKAMFRAEEEYRQNIAELDKQCDEIVAERRRNPDPDAHDLLNSMILDKDPKTGEQLSDENIRYQMVTFLIAGHETTSGLLSFTTYYMLKNPAVFVKARQEADKVIAEAGGNLLEINPAKLVYIDAILKEALRLQPPAPAWTVSPKSEDGEVLPGGYKVHKGQAISVLLAELHRDPEVWGPDPDNFRPERWLDGKPIAKDAWKPFGNGARACIGRGFAMQEAQLAIALIVSRFDMEMADKSYDLSIHQTLTIKPDHFKIIARPRYKNQSLLSELIAGGRTGTATHATKSGEPDGNAAPAGGSGSGKLYLLYGSNSGSCEGLAKELGSEGHEKGFDVTVSDLDSIATNGRLPTDGPVVICTASYEGKPTDNARNFVQAITSINDKDLEKGVKYIIMGAGHHDWASTFHKIPKFIDKRLEELGGERLMPLSTADAGGDIVGDFETFKAKLWEKLGTAPGGGNNNIAAKTKADEEPPKFNFEILPGSANPASNLLSADLNGIGTVIAQDVLTEHSDVCAQNNNIVIQLPDSQTYRAGDYLAVLPNNPQSAVDRVLARFALNKDDNIVLNLSTSYLPAKTPVRAEDLFSSYVELGQPVSKRVLSPLAEFCKDPKEKEMIKALEDNYVDAVTTHRLSLLDILDDNKSCKPPLDFFLKNLPRMKIRQYSISSTPLDNPEQASLTFTVHMVPSKSGHGVARGVASNYLAFLKPGDAVFCSVKPSAEFHLPSDPQTPIVMFAAGSGVAPMHGFIQERALQAEAGRKVGPTVLFYGCRTQNDILHRDDLIAWVKQGVLDLRPVFSRSKDTTIKGFEGLPITVDPETKYVQNRVWSDRKDVYALFDKGAQFYTCGSGAKLGADLRKTLVDIIRDSPRCEGKDPEEVMERLAKDRYRTDVFL